MIIDAWGATLAELESGPGVVVADLDMIGQRKIRQKFPVLEHRREF
jgi:nitrilase